MHDASFGPRSAQVKPCTVAITFDHATADVCRSAGKRWPAGALQERSRHVSKEKAGYGEFPEILCDLFLSLLLKFLLPYPDQVRVAAMWLREFVWELYPETNELIYDNYDAVAFGWSPTDKAGDVFRSVAVYSEYVNFRF